MSIRYVHSEVEHSISDHVNEFYGFKDISGYEPCCAPISYDDLSLLTRATDALSKLYHLAFSDTMSENSSMFAKWKVSLAFARVQLFFAYNYSDSSWFLPSDVAIEILKSNCDSLIFANDNKKSLFFIAFANRQICDAIRYSITEGKQSNEVKQSLRYALQYILFWWSIFAMPDPVKEAA